MLFIVYRHLTTHTKIQYGLKHGQWGLYSNYLSFMLTRLLITHTWTQSSSQHSLTVYNDSEQTHAIQSICSVSLSSIFTHWSFLWFWPCFAIQMFDLVCSCLCCLLIAWPCLLFDHVFGLNFLHFLTQFQRCHLY